MVDIGDSVAGAVAAGATASQGASLPPPDDPLDLNQRYVQNQNRDDPPPNVGRVLGNMDLGSLVVGKNRFDMMLGKAPFDKGSEFYEKWVLGLPEDPVDVEYTRLLRALKDKIRADQVRRQEKETQPALIKSERDARQMADRERAHRGSMGDVPIIKGMPVGPDAVFGDQETGDPQLSAWLQQFVKSTGLDLSVDQSSVAAKSGMYVYVGQEDDPEGGVGFRRDVFVYEEDAKSMLTAVDPEKLKGYQKRLGLEEHGLADPILQGYWDDAVQMAQLYARQGKKVDLQFIFDQLINAVEAKQRRSGGRGGGGGGIAGMSEEERTYDLYFAMMQVLGDISGVGNGS